MTEASESAPIPELRLQTPASEQQAQEISEKDEPSATPTNNQPQSRQSPENQNPTSHQLATVVQGTAENLLGRLEEAVNIRPKNGKGDAEDGESGEDDEEDEDEVLQDSEPGPLSKDPKDVEEVLNVISQSIYREGQGQVLLKLCDKSSLLSVVSHSLSAYITTLDPIPLQRLSARIAAEVSLWICDLFNFDDGAAYCHDDTRDGLIKVARMALHRNYPKMVTDGFETLFARPPVIYLTSNTYMEIAHHLCIQLGLPLSTVRVFQGTSQEQMEEMIAEDKAAGKLPTLCIANVHSCLYQSLGAITFQSVCRTNSIWLHLEGHALAGLSLVGGGEVPSSTPEVTSSSDGSPKTSAAVSEKEPLASGDSLSLTIGSWLGIPALPFVTLYKVVGLESFAQTAGLSTVVPSVRLNCLPLWCILRSLGSSLFKHRIGNIFELMEILNGKLGEISSLRVLSQRPETREEGYLTVDKLLSGDFPRDKLFRTVSPALAFQYVSSASQGDAKSESGSATRATDYYNNLNSWLGQTLLRDCPQIPFEIVDVETTGYVLRLCPFESLAFSGSTLTVDDLGVFVECLENQTSILDATVRQREKFIQSIDREAKLERIDIAHWAGLGGVSFIPQEAKGVADDEVRFNLINQRNIELLQRLRTLDSAFSIGESAEGRVCIRFGMVSMETDVEELLSLVVSTGSELDDQIVKLSQMGDLVRKGIEQAAEDLKRENDEAIWQEGVLRHVPIVGSLYNWISPLQKPQIKGRTLSLNEGKLQSTEVIYNKPNFVKPDESVDQVENIEAASKDVPPTPTTAPVTEKSSLNHLPPTADSVQEAEEEPTPSQPLASNSESSTAATAADEESSPQEANSPSSPEAGV